MSQPDLQNHISLCDSSPLHLHFISTGTPPPPPPFKVHSLWAFYCKSIDHPTCVRMNVTLVHNGRRRHRGPSFEKYRHIRRGHYEGCLSDDTPVVPLVSASGSNDSASAGCTFHTRPEQHLVFFPPPAQSGHTTSNLFHDREENIFLVGLWVGLCWGFFFQRGLIN